MFVPHYSCKVIDVALKIFLIIIIRQQKWEKIGEQMGEGRVIESDIERLERVGKTEGERYKGR